MNDLGTTTYKCHHCQKVILKLNSLHPFSGAEVCAECYQQILILFQQMKDGTGKLDIYK